MIWDEFYNKFYEWADSTQIKRISQLTTFGTHDEVSEIAQAVSDKNAASRLVLKALSSGVVFTADEIVDLQIAVTKNCMNELVKSCPYPFSQEQVEELVFSIDDDLYKDLERKYCNYDSVDFGGVDESRNIGPQNDRKPSKLFERIAFLGMLSDTSNRPIAPRFRIGDHVRVRYRGQEGTVVDINNGLYMVSLSDGGFIDSYQEPDLEKAW